MPKENEDFDLEESEVETGDNGDTNLVRELRKQAKDGKQAKREAESARSEADAAKRELALLKSGIDVNSPTGKLFAKSYEGELTAEAIKAEAEQYGLIPTSQTSEVKDDLSAIDRVSQASAGSQGFVAPTALDDIRNAEGDVNKILEILTKNGVPVSNEQPQPGFIRI